MDAAAIFALLVALSAKVLLLVAAGALAARMLRRASATSRHVLWTAVLGGVLVLALVAPLRPAWALPVGLPAALRVESTREPSGAEALERVPSSDAASALGAEPTSSLRWQSSATRILVLLWALGVVLFALRLVAGRVTLLRSERAARTLERGPARALLDSAGMRGVRLIESSAASVPATWGTFRPVIALPTVAVGWSRERLAAVLTHELAHVRRRDALTRLGADLCRALLWFHPAVWLARARMLAESERACDDAVLAAGTADVPYAETLVELAGAFHGGVRSTMAMADVRDLEDRLRAILDPTVRRESPRSVLASGPALALFVTAAMAGLDPWGTRAHAQEPVAVSAADTFDERMLITHEQEEAVLRRAFTPHDEREARAFAALRSALEHEKQHALDLVRERALWALSIAREDRVIEPLLAALDDDDWRVRAYAAWDLALIGVPEAREALTARLDDPAWRVRAHAASALADLADERSLNALLRCLDDDAWQVRLSAVEYLARSASPEARAAVQRCASDPHVAVRDAAEAALAAAAGQ